MRLMYGRNAYEGDAGQYDLEGGYNHGHVKIKDCKYYDIVQVEKETATKYYTLKVSDKRLSNIERLLLMWQHSS